MPATQSHRNSRIHLSLTYSVNKKQKNIFHVCLQEIIFNKITFLIINNYFYDEILHAKTMDSLCNSTILASTFSE